MKGGKREMKNNMPVMALMMLIMIVSLVFAIQGINMHSRVTVEEAKFHGLNEQYWNIDKVTRESAPSDSGLTNQLVEIQNFPSELLRLKLVGVGRILIGIYALLFGILIALVMMPVRLSKLLKK